MSSTNPPSSLRIDDQKHCHWKIYINYQTGFVIKADGFRVSGDYGYASANSTFPLNTTTKTTASNAISSIPASVKRANFFELESDSVGAMNKLIVLLETDQLAASLYRNSQLHATAISVANLENWSAAVTGQFGTIGIMQLDPQAADFSKRLNATERVLNSFTEQTVFATGPSDLRENVQELLLFGFTNVFCSQADAERFRDSSTQYWDSLLWPTQSLEERTLAELPWEQDSGDH